MYYILSMAIEESVEQSNSDLNELELNEWVKKFVVDENAITLEELKKSAQIQALIFSFKVGAGKVVSNYGGSFIGGSVAAGVAMGSAFCGVGAILGGIGGAILASTLDHNYTKHYSYQYDFINRFLNDFSSLEEELNHNTHCTNKIVGNNELSNEDLFYNISDKNILESLKSIIRKSHEYAHLRLTNEVETLGTTAKTIVASGIVSAVVGAGVGYTHLLGNTFLEPIVKGSLQGGSSNAVSSLLKGGGGEVVVNGAARGAFFGSVFGAVPVVLDTATSAIYEHGVKPLGEAAFDPIFDKVTDAVHTDFSTIYEHGVKPLGGAVSSAIHKVRPPDGTFDTVTNTFSSAIYRAEHYAEWSAELKNAKNFQDVDLVIKNLEKHDDDFAKDFRTYLNENHHDFLRTYYDGKSIVGDIPNEFINNRPRATCDTPYATDLSEILQNFIADRYKSSFDLLPLFIDTPSPNVTILKPTRHSMAIQNDKIDSSSELKDVNQKRIFSESTNETLNEGDSYVYAKAGGFINNVLQKEVNIVRNEDMNCLFINDCRLKNASIKIEFKGSEIELSFVNRDNTAEVGVSEIELSLVSRDTKKIESEVVKVQDILNSITINVFNQENHKNIKFTKIDEKTEPIIMEEQEAENRIRLIKQVVKPEQKVTYQSL